MSIFCCMLLPLPTPAADETPLVYGLALISVLEGICSHEGIAILRARASAYPRAPTACATRSPWRTVSLRRLDLQMQLWRYARILANCSASKRGSVHEYPCRALWPHRPAQLRPKSALLRNIAPSTLSLSTLLPHLAFSPPHSPVPFRLSSTLQGDFRKELIASETFFDLSLCCFLPVASYCRPRIIPIAP